MSGRGLSVLDVLIVLAVVAMLVVLSFYEFPRYRQDVLPVAVSATPTPAP